MKPVAYRYTDSFGTHYTDDEREVLDSPGIEEFTPLYESSGVDLGILESAGCAARCALSLSRETLAT